MTTRRDIELPPGPPAAGGSPGRKVIAAIGIDRYRHWQRLGNAVRDATRTAQLFEQLGFEQRTAPLLDDDATGKAIHSLVTTDLKKLGPDDSLVLFYAGHGATYEHRPAGEEIKTGYLIPVDAASSPDDVSSWIDLEGWLRAVALLPAKHILVILDACRSGIALDGIIQRHRGAESWRYETSAALQARRSRRIITSALGDQVALDQGPKHGHSLFTGCLIEGLTYDLRRQGERATTGSGLGTYLQRRVDAHTGSRQTPDFGYFFHDERGEIAIPLVGADPAPASALEQDPAFELAPWDASRQLHQGVPEPRPVEQTQGSPVERVEVGVEQPARCVQLEPASSGRPIATSPAPRHDPPAAAPSSPEPVAAGPPPAPQAPVARATEGRGHDRASRAAPLDEVELSVLLHRLEEAVTSDGQAMVSIAGLSCVLAWFATAVAFEAARSSALGALFAGLVAACMFSLMLYSAVWRVVVPRRMRRVARAVRDAPDRVVQLAHVAKSGWIEIRTSGDRFVMKPKHDRPAIFDALIRRCPAAKVTYL